MRLLLLGGTTEASMLAATLARRPGVQVTLSLAGRTAAPAPAPIPLRVGGFGGIEGLAAHLRDHRVEAMIDATHPFAARISAHAVAASRLARVPLLAFTRPPWAAGPADRWHLVPDIPAAIEHLAALTPRSVFLTTGRLDLPAFKAAPHHRYLVRTIEPPQNDALPPKAEVVLGRGPFAAATERELMQAHAIDLVVSKNSGGAASRAKLDIARELGVPVLMIERPAIPPRAACHTLGDALAWIEAHAGPPP